MFWLSRSVAKSRYIEYQVRPTNDPHTVWSDATNGFHFAKETHIQLEQWKEAGVYSVSSRSDWPSFTCGEVLYDYPPRPTAGGICQAHAHVVCIMHGATRRSSTRTLQVPKTLAARQCHTIAKPTRHAVDNRLHRSLARRKCRVPGRTALMLVV